MPKPKMMTLYQFESKNAIMDKTQYGQLTYLEWLEKEAARITRNGDRIAHVIWEVSKCSLEVDRVAEDE